MATRSTHPEDFVEDCLKQDWDRDAIIAYATQNLGPRAGQQVRDYLAKR